MGTQNTTADALPDAPDRRLRAPFDEDAGVPERAANCEIGPVPEVPHTGRQLSRAQAAKRCR